MSLDHNQFMVSYNAVNFSSLYSMYMVLLTMCIHCYDKTRSDKC